MKKLKEKIISIGKKLGARNFSPGLSGNISLRTDKGILITSSGSCLYELNLEDIVLIDYDANVINGNKKASSEKFIHTEIYKMRNDINSIIHCHSPKCSSLACAGLAMNKKILAESVFYFGEIPLADYGMPSSQELMTNTVKLFSDHNAVLMANHGIIIGANNIDNAYYQTETAEMTAEVYINTAILGKQKELSEKDVEDIFQLRRLMKS